ncbi:MAG TPA: hypothetical protein VIJ20_10330 [Solirubrobacteraceae bacterium]
MRFNLRAVGTALATATVFAIAAGPAAAASGPSLTKAVRDVHAANSALTQLSKSASSSPAAARSALARGRADIAAAAHQARWLHARSTPGAAATAFEGVAVQYDRDVQTYTSMLASSTGALRASLAQALVPAISGRTQALGFLGELAPTLPVAAASVATSTITGVVGGLPTEITSLTGLANAGDLPTEIEQLIAQAITAAGSVLDAGITELEGIIPSLPAGVQPIITTLLSTLTTVLGTVESTLEGTTSSIGGLLGGLIGTQLGDITSILQGILGDLPGLGTIGGTGTGTGTGTGGTTGTGGILGALPFGLGSILSGLLGDLGISMPGI